MTDLDLVVKGDLDVVYDLAGTVMVMGGDLTGEIFSVNEILDAYRRELRRLRRLVGEP